MTEELKQKGRRLQFTIKKRINDEAVEILKDIDINLQIEGSGTPLLIACLHNNTEIAKYCIEHGAYTNISDEDKSTPLHYACEKGNFELIKLLVEKGANINHQNKYDKSPLAKAIAKNPKMVDIIEFLLKNGGNAFLDEKYMKDDPRRTNFSAYEYAKNDIKSNEIVAIIEKYHNFKADE